MPARLVKPAKVEYEWFDLEELSRRLVAPRERIASVRDPEEEEQIRRSMGEDPEGFFDRSPILLTTSGDREKLFLGDGGGRLEIAKQLRVAKIKARIEHYADEESAYLAAVDASYIINSARGRVLPYNKVSYAAFLKSKGLSAKDVAKRMALDEKTVYHLWKIAESAPLMERLKRGEISLREAINLVYVDRRTSLARETAHKPGASKSGRPGKGKRRGVAKPAARAERAGKGATQPEEKRSAKDALREVERALQELGITDERDKRALLRDFERVFADTDPDLAVRAIQLWKSSGGALTFLEALEKSKRGEVVEESEEVEEVYECPSCGGLLVCTSCGWPKGVRRE